MSLANIVSSVMASMSHQQKIFCSEADFQFSFAQELQRLLPTAAIYLEKCIYIGNIPYYVDLVFRYNTKEYFIEFKYPTSSASLSYLNFSVLLKNQGAQDLARYDYLYDIYRLLNISKSTTSTFGGGCALILTNDRLLYSSPAKVNTKVLDYFFRIHKRQSVFNSQAYPVPGQVKWNVPSAVINHWTAKGQRSLSFTIPTISTAWNDYLKILDNNNVRQDFMFLTNYIRFNTELLIDEES